MNIREIARKAGGDELVADLDFGKQIQLVADRALKTAIDGIVEAYTTDNARRNAFIRVALVEALSEAYANIAVAVGTETASLYNEEVERPALIALAIRSITGNMDKAWENQAVEGAGIADLIQGAAKKGGAK